MTMEVEFAPDVKILGDSIVDKLEMIHIDPERVVYMRSTGSKSDALARIWELPRIWQKAMNMRARYIIEVLSEKYDLLLEEEKEKTIIHELLHIPKSFSGATVSHKHFGKHKVNKRIVDKLHKQYKKP